MREAVICLFLNVFQKSVELLEKFLYLGNMKSLIKTYQLKNTRSLVEFHEHENWGTCEMIPMCCCIKGNQRLHHDFFYLDLYCTYQTGNELGIYLHFIICFNPTDHPTGTGFPCCAFVVGYEIF